MTARIPFARVVPGALCLLAVACGSSAAHSTSAGTRTAPVPASHPVNGTILDAASGREVGAVDANGMISGATADGHGGWYLAGAFTRVDGRPRAHLAHVNADGSLDPAWRPPALGPAARTQFVSVADTGSLVLVAGVFRTVGGKRSTGAVALDPTTGSVDPDWHTPALCADGNWAIRAAPGAVDLATACAAQTCLVALAPQTGGVRTGWEPGIQAVGEEACIGDTTLSNWCGHLHRRVPPPSAARGASTVSPPCRRRPLIRFPDSSPTVPAPAIARRRPPPEAWWSVGGDGCRRGGVRARDAAHRSGRGTRRRQRDHRGARGRGATPLRRRRVRPAGRRAGERPGRARPAHRLRRRDAASGPAGRGRGAQRVRGTAPDRGELTGHRRGR